jgi:hypothetical protein
MYCFRIESGAPPHEMIQYERGPEDGHLIGELLAQEPGTGGLEVVAKVGEIQVGRVCDQRVDVISLPVEFKQGSSPS